MKDVLLTVAFLAIFVGLLFLGIAVKALPFIFALSLFN